jgi:hypothetical protein
LAGTQKSCLGIGELKPEEFWRLTLVKVLDVIEAVSEEKPVK